VIVDCVRRNHTNVDLILITINGMSCIIQKQIANITSVLKFMGPQIASRTCLLITHFENRCVDDEKKWISDFTSDPRMQFLTTACKGGFLFTGALNKTRLNDPAIRSAFTIQQTRRNVAFFNKLMTGDRVPLLPSTVMNNIKCMIAIQNEVPRNYLNSPMMHTTDENPWHTTFETWLRVSTVLSKKVIEAYPILKKHIDALYQRIIDLREKEKA